MLYSLVAIITGEISSKKRNKNSKIRKKLKSFLEINFNPRESELRKNKLGKNISRFLNLVFSVCSQKYRRMIRDFCFISDLEPDLAKSL
jgi:hypothetical protein